MKFSNKKLFEIRDIKGKYIIAGLLILVAIIGFLALIISVNGTFATKFHGATHYKPLDKTNSGLYGKVNFYLEKAREQGYSNTNITIENLNTIYPALTFYCPADSAYLISPEEVRLIGFEPDSIKNLNKKEREELRKFYYNSIFSQLIEKQRNNFGKQYFIIKWTKDGHHIESIKIDPTLGDMPLLNDSWKGNIMLDDPFSQIDTNVVYLIKDNIPLPLFTSNLTLNSFRNHTPYGYDTIFVRDWNSKLISQFEQMYRNQSNGRPLDVYFRNRNEHIRLLNTGKEIYIQPYNLNVKVYFDGRDTLIVSNSTKQLPVFNNILKIKLLYNNDSTTIYFSKSVFNIASKISNEGTGKRVNINKDYVDLFSMQQLIHLESNIKTQQQSQVELSTNIFLAKTLEGEIMSYVNHLYRDTRWRDKDEFQMSVCLMDIATGEVIAAPFYSNLFDKTQRNELTEYRNFNLENHHIGSTFKPLLAFAAVAKYRNLSQFRLTNMHFISKDSCSILGYTVPSYGLNQDKTAGKSIFWGECNNLDRLYFLGHSHDNYPIALTMLALTEPTEHNIENRDRDAFELLRQATLNNTQINNLHGLLRNIGTRIRYYPQNTIKKRILFNDQAAENVDLGESSFANLMKNLYNIKTINRDTVSLWSDKYVWRLLNKIPNGISIIFPDIVNLQWENVKNFIDFENLILGQGDNRWNNIKLAEAYARLLSKRKLQATFLKNRIYAENLFSNPYSLFNFEAPYFRDKREQELNNTWTLFLRDWNTVVRENSITRTPGDGNTLNDAFYNFRLSFANQDSLNNYLFYCKIGTPDEEKERTFNKYLNGGVDRRGNHIPVWYDEGVFVFGITNNSITNDNNVNPRGIIGVVYIKHISEIKGGSGVESSTARDFLTPELYSKIMFYNQNCFGR